MTISGKRSLVVFRERNTGNCNNVFLHYLHNTTYCVAHTPHLALPRATKKRKRQRSNLTPFHVWVVSGVSLSGVARLCFPAGGNIMTVVWILAHRDLIFWHHLTFSHEQDVLSALYLSTHSLVELSRGYRGERARQDAKGRRSKSHLIALLQIN